jgi:hypothetical protein
MALQGVVNRLVRGALRTPLLCRVLGRALMTLDVVGRTSGRRYVVPVAYVWHGERLLVGTSFGWGRNLRSGEPVDVRFMGRRRRADVEVVTDEAGVVELYGVLAAENRNFATFNMIGIDADGRPDAEDLHRAWAAGARAFLFTLR